MLRGRRSSASYFGDDLDTLIKLGDDLLRLLACPGADRRPGGAPGPHSGLACRRQPGRRAALWDDPAQLTHTLETLTSGRVVSEVVDENRRYDVVIRLNDEDRTNNGQPPIDTPSGRVPLYQLATVVDTTGRMRSFATTACGASPCWRTPMAPTLPPIATPSRRSSPR